jgi:hypothetical protein
MAALNFAVYILRFERDCFFFSFFFFFFFYEPRYFKYMSLGN